jgi:membrane protease YdiL (CAAX protease family)
VATPSVLNRSHRGRAPDIDLRALGIFFSLAYVIAWLAWLPLILGVHGLHITSWNVPMPWVIPGTFGPTFAALATQRLYCGDWRAANVWTTWRSLLKGAIVGPGLIIFALTVVTCGTMAKGGPAVLHWSAIAGLPMFILSSLRAGPLGEEAGWRGFALPRLKIRLGSLSQLP